MEARRMENEEKVQEAADNLETNEETMAEEAEAGEEQGTGDVYSLSQWVILMFTESAWQWMGLHKNPVTKKIEKDLLQAKLAIDTVVYLTDQVAPHISEEQRRAYRSLVNDLRVNFVQQQS